MMYDTITISSDEDDDPLNVARSSADSDEDDHLPLKAVRASLQSIEKVVLMNDLKRQSVQQCEFCEEVFLNRYDALIHNAKHIIIPLLKQEVIQCVECLYYYTSPEELAQHMQQKHAAIQLLKCTECCTFYRSNEELMHHKKEKHVIKPAFRKENVVKPEIQVKKDVKVLNFMLSDLNKEPIVKIEDIILKPIIDSRKKPVCNMITKKEEVMVLDKAREKISNRLKFEDDIGDFETAKRDLLNDLTTECKVKVNVFDLPWNGGVGESDVNLAKTETAVCEINDKVYSASTHYDLLVQPGMYKCKRCTETFATRFHLIQHDTRHLRIRKARPLLCEICERFISNNHTLLKQHILKKHNMHAQRPKPTQKCKKCGLKFYNYIKHMHNYHELVYCHLCSKGFDSDNERLDHIREHLIETKCLQCDFVSTAIEVQEHQRTFHRISNVSTMRICETCCLFVKNKQNMQYVSLGSVSEYGTRLSCERCCKKFFSLQLVRRLHKMKDKEHLYGEREKKKHLTNSDRLKNIQQRLKMINRLSRF